MMKKKSVAIKNILIRGLASLALLSSSHANAQYMTDPLTNAGTPQPWKAVGNNTPTIAGGILDLSPTNGHGGSCNYLYRQLKDDNTGSPFTLNTTNAWSWTAQFQFTPSSTLAQGVDFFGGPVPGIPGHTLLALTGLNNSSQMDNSVNQCNSLYSISSLNDIEIDYTCNALTGANSTSNNWYLTVNVKKAAGNATTFTTATTPIYIDPVASNGKPFYIQLQMLTQGEGMINVYTDPSFSPTYLYASQCFNVDWAVTSLGYVQAGIIPQGGSYRALNATIQNLNIWNNSMCLDYGSDWVKTPSSGGTVYNTATSYTFSNCFDNSDNRIDKNIGALISNSQEWTAYAHFNITNVSNNFTFGPGHDILALSAGGGNNIFPMTVPNQDVILADLYGTGSSYAMYGRSKKATNWAASSAGIPVVKNTDYYLVLQRLCSTVGQISVYTDAAHINIVGTQTFSIDPTLTGLNNVQIGSQQWGNGTRELSGYVNNICINNNLHDGGTIASSQTVCAGVAVPTITAAAPPTLGTCGLPINYYWEQAAAGTPVGGSGWTVIPGATSASYTPGPLSTSTSFIRYASTLPGSCLNWWSNVVTYSVNPGMNINASFMLAPVSSTGNPYFTATASAVALPVGETFWWDVQQVTPSGSTFILVNGTDLPNPSQWWYPAFIPNNSFAGYWADFIPSTAPIGATSFFNYGSTTPPSIPTSANSPAGNFVKGNYYKVTRCVFGDACTAPACASQVMFICATCKTTNGEDVFTVVEAGDDIPEQFSTSSTVLSKTENEISVVSKNTSLNIYPNPNNGLFNVESENYFPNTPIEITDMMGRTVWSQTFTDLKHQTIDMSGFENGIYFIKIQGAVNYSIKKIVKE